MTTRQPATIKVYWDNRDPRNNGWTWETSDAAGVIASGGIDAGPLTLDSAIDDVIFDLALPLHAHDFAREPKVDGGFAVWTR